MNMCLSLADDSDDTENSGSSVNSVHSDDASESLSDSDGVSQASDQVIKPETRPFIPAGAMSDDLMQFRQLKKLLLRRPVQPGV